MTLYDGARFVSAWRWPHLRDAARGMAERGTRVSHPSFRLVALATPPRAWLGLLKGLGDRVKSALRRMITNDWGAINLNLGKSWARVTWDSVIFWALSMTNRWNLETARFPNPVQVLSVSRDVLPIFSLHL